MSGRKRDGDGAADLTRHDIETIIDIVKSAPDIAEFSLKYGEIEIFISRGSHSTAREQVRGEAQPSQAPARPPADMAATVMAESPPSVSALAARRSNEIVVEAPMVGTFYRAPAPGEAPFVSVGDTVASDAVLCIIEVMKLMNSIAAPRAGTVKQILVGDGEGVEFGQPLIVIEVDG